MCAGTYIAAFSTFDSVQLFWNAQRRRKSDEPKCLRLRAGHTDGPLLHLLQSISGERQARRNEAGCCFCGEKCAGRVRWPPDKIVRLDESRRPKQKWIPKNQPRRWVNVGTASAAAITGGREGRLARQRQWPAPRRPRPMDRKTARHGPWMDRRPRTSE